jgi:LemA protein
MTTTIVLGLSSGEVVAIVAGGVVLAIVITVISMYNRLVKLRQFCKESWSDTDTELQRRHDLIPNLVSSVKGYAAHESKVMEEVTRLRNQAVSEKSDDPATRAAVEDGLGAATKQLIATAEAYPDLKADSNFLKLQTELSETETRIARARRFYNSNVRGFMEAIQTFPSSIVAGMTGFRGEEFVYFKADQSSREAIDVEFK